jgi:uncharacterized cupin superfamily protein
VTKALKAMDIPEKRGSSYPNPHDEPCVERSNRRLGDVFGLADFGANLLTLEPGAWSSQRHWHSHEDELIYVLEGAPSLITDAGEQLLEPGSVAGFPAGSTDGHHLVNNGDGPALVLVVGSRKLEDDAFYSDIDMQLLKRAQGGRFTHKNGEPY